MDDQIRRQILNSQSRCFSNLNNNSFFSSLFSCPRSLNSSVQHLLYFQYHLRLLHYLHLLHHLRLLDLLYHQYLLLLWHQFSTPMPIFIHFLPNLQVYNLTEIYSALLPSLPMLFDTKCARTKRIPMNVLSNSMESRRL